MEKVIIPEGAQEAQVVTQAQVEVILIVEAVEAQAHIRQNQNNGMYIVELFLVGVIQQYIVDLVDKEETQHYFFIINMLQILHMLLQAVEAVEARQEAQVTVVEVGVAVGALAAEAAVLVVAKEVMLVQ